MTTSPVTAYARSTGARRPVERASWSTSITRNETPTSCCSSTASRICATGVGARSTTRCVPRRRSPPAISSAGTASAWSSFGGVLRWLRPGLGPSQRFRLIETLLETGVAPTYIWRDVDLIPARILPPKALVIALTPLVDPRFVRTLQNLRARGFDLVVVEIDPVERRRGGEERARASRVSPVAARSRGAPVATRTSRHRHRALG